MLSKFRVLLLILVTTATIYSEEEGRHIGFNFGLAPSKTLLGGFYSWGRNQINVGTDVTFYTFEEGVIIAQPTITYNRYLSKNGFYASTGLIATHFARQDHEVRERAILPDTGWTYRTVDDPDWKRPLAVFGFGKDFRWTHWGVHVEADLFTPFGSDFMQTREYWLGGGLSYRFKLE